MTNTPERILEIMRVEQISEAIGYPVQQGHAFIFMEMNGVEDFEHVLISRMEEDIVRIGRNSLTLVNVPEEKLFSCFCLAWGVNGAEHESRLEATFTAWQEVHKQTTTTDPKTD